MAGDGEGWPNWFLFRPNRLVAVELKGTGGTLTLEQGACLEDLRAAGTEAYCFWPEQREEIEEILK